jgi:rod shape-determining protein MreC
VIDARGMIGRIFLAGNHTSWVILLTDLNSRIPVNVEPGNAQAIMAGDNSGAPVLDLLSQNVTLKPGAQVVSSGDGGLLPPGLAIGTVVGDAQGGYRVVLLADPGASDDVNVVDFKLKTEQPPAATANELPATAAGLPPAAPPQPAPITVPLSNAAAPAQKVPPQVASPSVKPAGNTAGAAPEPPPSDTGNE